MSTRNQEGFRRFVAALLCVGTLDAAPTFQMVRQIAGHGAPLAVADFDEDGRLDFAASAVTPAGGMTNVVFLSRSDLTFERRGLPEMDFVFGSVGLGDLDRDGDVDAVRSGWVNGFGYQSQVLRNASGVFTTAGERLPGELGVWADLDNEGVEDLLLLDGGAGGAQLWLGDPQGNFHPIEGRLGARVSSASAADFDNDGDLDLLLRELATDGSEWFRNDGTGRFERTGTRLPVGHPASGAWGDFDQDGDLDLIVAGTRASNQPIPQVWRNEGLAAWTAVFPEILPVNAWPVVAADLDQEGRLDAFLAPAAKAFLGKEDGTWLEVSLTPIPGESVTGGVAADFDDDGDLDLLVSVVDPVTGIPSARLYRNSATNRLAGPAPPKELEARVGAGQVTLAWAANDASEVMTSYALRVGTRPDAGDILSALSEPDGRRRVTGLGNAQAAMRRTLRGLAPGAYYWSVQAVGPAGHPSAFAAERSFTLTGQETNSPPVVSTIPNWVAEEDGPVIALPFTVGDAETAVEALMVSASSSNAELVPLGRMTIVGTGTERILEIRPAADQAGVTLITLSAQDAEGQRGSTSFWLTVVSVNDPPTLAAIASQTAYEGGPPLNVALQYSDVETALSRLEARAGSSDERLIPANGLKLRLVSGGGGARLSIAPAAGRLGSASVTVEVSDGEVTVARSFVVTVLPAPYVAEDTGLQSFTTAVLSLADFDNDDDLDLLVLGQSAFSNLSAGLYRNDGSGRFTDSGIPLPRLRNARVAWMDFDRDGDLDLACMGAEGARHVTRLLRNRAGAGFEALDPDLPGTSDGTLDWGDFDRDGLPDLLLAGYGLGAESWRLYRNADGTRFERVPLAPLNLDARGATWADYDGDGWLDFVLSGDSRTGPMLTLHRNESGGVFRAFDSGVAISARELGWEDFNRDGLPELWAVPGSARLPAMDLTVLVRDGDGHFTLAARLSQLLVPVTWHDADADGDADLLAAGTYEFLEPWLPRPPEFGEVRIAKLWRQDDNYRFGDAGAVAGTASLDQFVTGDVDGDDSLDLVAVTGLSVPGLGDRGNVRLFRGAGRTLNRVPTAPESLVAEALGNGVTLSWAAATDENQSGGFTYNVRVGTTPGGSEVLAPAASARGFVRLPAPGNAGWLTRMTLTNLVGETFYWSVQALDASHAGSAFALEQSFVLSVPNQPPALGEIDPQATPEDAIFELPVPVSDDRTPMEQLRLFATSSDPSLLPQAEIGLHWTNGTWRLRLLPASNQVGMAVITLVVQDRPGLRATNQFELTVTEVNDPPSISAIADQATAFGVATLPIPFVVADPDSPIDQLELSAVSGNPALLPPDHIRFGGHGTNRTVTAQPVGSSPGMVTVEVRVRDDGGATATTQFVLTIKPQHFAALPNPFAGFRGDTAAFGDYDRDGDLDVVIAGDAGAALTRVYRNEGGGQFVDSGLQLPNVRGGTARWGDYDNDGDLDLLLTGSYETNGLHVYRNDREAGFVRIELGTVSFNWVHGEWADYDNDGDLDFVVAGEWPNPTLYSPALRLYVNQGGDVFSVSSLELPQRDGPLAWGDLDNDGWPDLAVSGTSREALTFTVETWRNLAGAGFESGLVRTTFARDGVQWADLDGDGALDLALTQHTSTSTSLLRNRSDGTFTEWRDPLPVT